VWIIEFLRGDEIITAILIMKILLSVTGEFLL